MKLAMIGQGAIAQYVSTKAIARGHDFLCMIVRPEKVSAGCVARIEDLPDGIDLIIDCAGHSALRQFAPTALRSGIDVLTVSIGALADQSLEDELTQAAQQGGSSLHLASGAIGALDALGSARIGDIKKVHYIGRKPPRGWLGSPAEAQLDLLNMGGDAQSHFDGTARVAALAYPKNANVAAAVALAGIGFDKTQVTLIADPNVTENIHEVHCEGAFGAFNFQIAGNALPDNPRSSALAAMSVISTLDALNSEIKF